MKLYVYTEQRGIMHNVFAIVENLWAEQVGCWEPQEETSIGVPAACLGGIEELCRWELCKHLKAIFNNKLHKNNKK